MKLQWWNSCRYAVHQLKLLVYNTTLPRHTYQILHKTPFVQPIRTIHTTLSNNAYRKKSYTVTPLTPRDEQYMVTLKEQLTDEQWTQYERTMEEYKNKSALNKADKKQLLTTIQSIITEPTLYAEFTVRYMRLLGKEVHGSRIEKSINQNTTTDINTNLSSTPIVSTIDTAHTDPINKLRNQLELSVDAANIFDQFMAQVKPDCIHTLVDKYIEYIHIPTVQRTKPIRQTFFQLLESVSTDIKIYRKFVRCYNIVTRLQTVDDDEFSHIKYDNHDIQQLQQQLFIQNVIYKNRAKQLFHAVLQHMDATQHSAFAHDYMEYINKPLLQRKRDIVKFIQHMKQYFTDDKLYTQWSAAVRGGRLIRRRSMNNDTNAVTAVIAIANDSTIDVTQDTLVDKQINNSQLHQSTPVQTSNTFVHTATQTDTVDAIDAIIEQNTEPLIPLPDHIDTSNNQPSPQLQLRNKIHFVNNDDRYLFDSIIEQLHPQTVEQFIALYTNYINQSFATVQARNQFVTVMRRFIQDDVLYEKSQQRVLYLTNKIDIASSDTVDNEPIAVTSVAMSDDQVVKANTIDELRDLLQLQGTDKDIFNRVTSQLEPEHIPDFIHTYIQFVNTPNITTGIRKKFLSHIRQYISDSILSRQFGVRVMSLTKHVATEYQNVPNMPVQQNKALIDTITTIEQLRKHLNMKDKAKRCFNKIVAQLEPDQHNAFISLYTNYIAYDSVTKHMMDTFKREMQQFIHDSQLYDQFKRSIKFMTLEPQLISQPQDTQQYVQQLRNNTTYIPYGFTFDSTMPQKITGIQQEYITSDDIIFLSKLLYYYSITQLQLLSSTLIELRTQELSKATRAQRISLLHQWLTKLSTTQPISPLWKYAIQQYGTQLSVEQQQQRRMESDAKYAAKHKPLSPYGRTPDTPADPNTLLTNLFTDLNTVAARYFIEQVKVYNTKLTEIQSNILLQQPHQQLYELYDFLYKPHRSTMSDAITRTTQTIKDTKLREYYRKQLKMLLHIRQSQPSITCSVDMLESLYKSINANADVHTYLSGIYNNTTMTYDLSNNIYDTIEYYNKLQHKVVLYNIPIDIGINELAAAFIRCGHVVAVEICRERLHYEQLYCLNQQTQAEEQYHSDAHRKQFVVDPSITHSNVYGFVYFDNAESVQYATQFALRSLGIIVERKGIGKRTAKKRSKVIVDTDDNGRDIDSTSDATTTTVQKRMNASNSDLDDIDNRLLNSTESNDDTTYTAVYTDTLDKCNTLHISNLYSNKITFDECRQTIRRIMQLAHLSNGVLLRITSRRLLEDKGIIQLNFRTHTDALQGYHALLYAIQQQTEHAAKLLQAANDQLFVGWDIRTVKSKYEMQLTRESMGEYITESDDIHDSIDSHENIDRTDKPTITYQPTVVAHIKRLIEESTTNDAHKDKHNDVNSATYDSTHIPEHTNVQQRQM